MASLSKAAFEALYGTTGTTFPDNTTGDISEGDMRQFGKDIADSLFTPAPGSLSFTTVNIGDWNMDTTTSVTINPVSHGVAHADIRGYIVVVRQDSDGTFPGATYQAPFIDGSDVAQLNVAVNVSGVGIVINRKDAGTFDHVDFNETSYNRGWLTIIHV